MNKAMSREYILELERQFKRIYSYHYKMLTRAEEDIKILERRAIEDLPCEYQEKYKDCSEFLAMPPYLRMHSESKVRWWTKLLGGSGDYYSRDNLTDLIDVLYQALKRSIIVSEY